MCCKGGVGGETVEITTRPGRAGDVLFHIPHASAPLCVLLRPPGEKQCIKGISSSIDTNGTGKAFREFTAAEGNTKTLETEGSAIKRTGTGKLHLEKYDCYKSKQIK